MAGSADVSLAIGLEDITLLECVFHAEAPITGRDLERRLLVRNPSRQFTLDVKRRCNVLRANVSIQFGLFDRKEKVNVPDLGLQPFEVVHFGLIAGVVVSSPLMGEATIAPQHLAGFKGPEAHRDASMERAMRLEAIKAAYGMATAKLLELSSMSPIDRVTLPLIDTEEIYDDMSIQEDGKAVEGSAL